MRNAAVADPGFSGFSRESIARETDFDFTQMSGIRKIDDLASSLTCELRPDGLRAQAAMQFIRARLSWRPISDPTFYNWRKLAFVTERGLYSGTALLYMEILGLHLREWGSRPCASQAVAELLAWQLHLHNEWGIAFADSAFALGHKLGEARSVGLAAGQVEEMIYQEKKRNNHAYE